MKLLEAVCLNLSLNISELRSAFLKIISRSDDDRSPGILFRSNFLGIPIMKLSSEMVTDTLEPIRLVIL